MRAPCLLVVALALGCQSAEHRDLTKRIGKDAGTRVVSNVLEAPAGATWTWARVQTHAYRSTPSDAPFSKEWAVWTDLMVEHVPQRYASTRLATREEGEDPADALVAQVRKAYQLRLVGPDQLELSDDGGATWIAIPVPAPRELPDAGEPAELAPPSDADVQ